MAMVDQVDVDESVRVSKYMRVNASEQIVVDALIKATRLFGQGLTTQIVVEDEVGPLRKNMRVTMIVDIAAAPTAFDIAQSVWAQQLAGFTTAGSSGKALQDAGAAGNPLDELIESDINFRNALRIMLSAMAGKVSGAGTGTVTFRNTPDTKNRIVAEVDNDGNRTNVTLDVT
jgi:hypothetical protein